MRHIIIGIALLLGACATPTDSETATSEVTLDLEMAYTDGAGVEREAHFIDAALLDDGLRLRYRALIDGQPRTIEYAQYGSDTPLELSVHGPEGAELALFIEGEEAEFVIAGESVGAFDWTAEGSDLETQRQGDPLSFALLSLFPHQVEGLQPELLFAHSEAHTLGGGLEALEQGKITLKGVLKAIGGLFSGGARAGCTKLPDICSQMGTESPDGGGCQNGSACGKIKCCAGSCQTGGFSYEASVGTND